jgi:hypothetical protein
VGSNPTPRTSNGLLDEHPSIPISLAFSKGLGVLHVGDVVETCFHKFLGFFYARANS